MGQFNKEKNTFNFFSETIFILGIRRRSGTNFLYDLLCLHPDCIGSILKEDFLMANANLLIGYVNAYYERLSPVLKIRTGPPDLLYRCLGDGLISFLNLHFTDQERSPSSCLKKLVAETPSIENLQYFFKLFPSAPLLIIIRDGRAVVESNVKSFNSNYEDEMRQWANAASTIIQFQQENRDNDHRYLIVRYEDIYSNTKPELKKIFTFLGLDAEIYNFEAAMNLPVRGSSELRAQGGKMHWKPVAKTPDFNPIMRWSHWSQALHEQFNGIAGDYLEHFGYTKQV